MQAICDGLTAEAIDGLLRKWLARLPHPFTPADRAAGYRYAAVDPAGRVLPDPGARPPGLRADLLRADHPRQPRHRPPGPGRADLRPAGPAQHPGVFRTRVITDTVTPSLHIDYKHCQIKQYHKQGTGAAHRDHDQRHLRLRHRPTADQPARAAGDRLHRQPTPAARPTTQPRPHRRRRRPRRDHRPDHHRHRATGPRAAVHRPPRPGAALGDLRVPAAAPRLHPPRPTPPPGTPTRATPRDDDQRADHLRPTPAARCTASSPASRTATATSVTDTGLRHALFLTHAHNRLLRTGLAETPPAHPSPDQAPRRRHAPTNTPSTHLTRAARTRRMTTSRT